MDLTGNELPAKKNQYLKFMYLQEGPVKITAISRHFGIAPSTVTRALKELTKTGFITYSRYQGADLTSDGRLYARFLVRRHRILSLMFTRSGLSNEDACIQAELIESLVSRTVTDTICASLGHPTMSICGRIEHDSHYCCPKNKGEELL